MATGRCALDEGDEVHHAALDLAQTRTDRGEPRTLQGHAQHLDHVVRRVEDGDDGTRALFGLDGRRDPRGVVSIWLTSTAHEHPRA
jgi:hypothetical protein